MKNKSLRTFFITFCLFYVSTLFSQTKTGDIFNANPHAPDHSIHCGHLQPDELTLENLAVSVTKLKFIPSVVNYNATGNVIIEATVTGTPSRLTLNKNSVYSDFNDSGTNGDRVAGDNIFTLSIPAQNIVSILQTSDAYRPFLGYLELYEGGVKQSQRNVFHQVRTADMPDVTIQTLGSNGNAQASSRIFNTTGENFNPNYQTTAQRFYQYYRDNFDFMNFICVPGSLNNRFHFSTRNDVTGIGVSIINNTSSYGSAGYLKGCNVFPIPYFYDPAEQGYVHEIGHQWIQFAQNTPLSGGIPHWPMSNIASAVMGFSIGGTGGAGGNFFYNFTPQTGGYLMTILTTPNYPVFNDWEQYLMGLIPKTSVTTTALIFNNQTTTPATGFHPSSDFTEYTINSLVSTLGERVPNSTSSQKNFKAATVIISDELLTASEMAYYHFMTLRADMTTSVPAASGFVQKMGTPFYLATNGLATLNTSLSEAIIPLELLSFNAQKRENNAFLEWKTASEKGIKNFDIEKSTNGQKFEKIADIKPSNTPSGINTYQVQDEQFIISSYYRLKTNELDGTSSYSKTVFLEKATDKRIKIQWHTEGGVFVETTDPIESIIISNMIGQILKTTKDTRLDFKDLPTGIYIIAVKTSRGYLSEKVFKQ